MPEAAAPHPPPDDPGSDAVQAPACPLCGTTMVMRLSRRGPAAGSRYWGCPRDPECGGRQDLEPGDAAHVRDQRSSSSIRATAAPRARSAPTGTVERVSTRRPEPDMTSLPMAGEDRARLRLRPDILAIAGVLAIVGVALWIVGPGAVGAGVTRDPSLLGPLLIGGALILAIASVVTPPRHRAWQPRGDADRATSRALAPLMDEGWVLLEDRRMPASSEVVRHLLIGPGGVFTIASRTLTGRVAIRGHDLYLNGRRRTGFVEAARRQAAAVVSALRGAGHADTATALLCVHRAQLPVFGSALNGVAILDGAALVRRLRSEPPKLNTERVAILTDALGRAMPPAERPGI